MSTIKVGINGIGRIGRTLLKAHLNQHAAGLNKNIEIVALNNPGDPEIYLHLLKYDSVHGPLNRELSFNKGTVKIDNQEMKFHGLYDPAEIPWSDQDVDIVIDCTGRFKDSEALGKHKNGTVKKVIMCAPGKNLDGTFVVGINHKEYDNDKHHIISNASCTTNCLAPVAKVINDTFGIETGFMTTVHAYTSDQNILDNSHSDMRRARAAAISMIPTTTGAAKALGQVIPDLQGKLDGYAIRVPTPNVSMVDLTVNLKKAATKEEINAAIKEASESSLKHVLGYTEEELVSCDFVGKTESSYFDSKLTNVIGNTAKVVSWYDNEAGFSNRVLDLASFVAEKL